MLILKNNFLNSFIMKKSVLFAVICWLPVVLLAQWSTDPQVNNAIATASGEEAIPKIAIAESGTTYISWFSNESGNYNVRLQKLDVFGNKQWADEGLLVSDNASMTWLTDWDMTVDQDDCAILTLQDIRTGNNNIFAYRISPEGDFLWGADGLQLSNSPTVFNVSPKVVVTNSGNVIIAWQADNDIIRQKIAPDGTLLWGNNGITMTGTNAYSWPQLLPVGTDDVIMKYFEDSGSFPGITRHVFAQRYDTDGNAVWAQDAVVSTAGGISPWTQIFPFINDGSDGFYIAWHDDRDFNNLASVYVQHIGPDGTVLLGDNGIEASTMPNRNHFYAQLSLPQNSEDIFVYWNEMDADQINRGIYGQKISATGERLWTDNGKKFIDLSSLDVYPYAARNSDDNTVLFYEENPSGPNAIIKAMGIDPDGNSFWSTSMVDICSLSSSKVHTVTSDFHDGQWITAWEDNRNGGSDIYGQNLKLDGTLGPVTIVYTPDISPDTLWFDTYQNTSDGEYFMIKNNNDVSLTITNIPLNNVLTNWMWSITNFSGSFPYTLEPGDSLNMLVTIGFITNMPLLLDYVYDDIPIEMESNDYAVTIGLNSDLIISNNEQFIEQPEIYCYPNPAVGSVSFQIPSEKNGEINLSILDSKGQIVKHLGLTLLNQKNNIIIWDGTNQENEKVKSGTYFYILNTGEAQKTGKIILL